MEVDREYSGDCGFLTLPKPYHGHFLASMHLDMAQFICSHMYRHMLETTLFVFEFATIIL